LPTPQASSAPAAPRVFHRGHRTFLDFLRNLSGTHQRFWLLVAATGVAGGLGAVLLVHLLRAVQALVWTAHAGSLDAADTVATPLRHVLVPLAGGVIVTIVALIMKRPLGSHGTSGVLEAIWIKAGHLPLGKPSCAASCRSSPSAWARRSAFFT